MAPIIFDNPKPYSASKKWQIKIFDNEPGYEEPHVSVIYKEHPLKTWRINLKTLEVMDAMPPKRKLPKEFMSYVRTNIEQMRDEWNKKYPNQKIEAEKNKAEPGDAKEFGR